MEEQTKVKQSLMHGSNPGNPPMPSGSTEHKPQTLSPPANLPTASSDTLSQSASSAVKQEPATVPAPHASSAPPPSQSPQMSNPSAPKTPASPAPVTPPASSPTVGRPPITPPDRPIGHRPMLCVTKKVPPLAKYPPVRPSAEELHHHELHHPAPEPSVRRPIPQPVTSRPAPPVPRAAAPVPQPQRPMPQPSARKPAPGGVLPARVSRSSKETDYAGKPSLDSFKKPLAEKQPASEDIKIPSNGKMEKIVAAVLSGVLLLAIGGGVYYYLNLTKQRVDFTPQPPVNPVDIVPEEEQPSPVHNQGEFQTRLTATTTTVDVTEIDDIPIKIQELSSSPQVQKMTQVILAINGNEINLAQLKEAFNMTIPENLVSEEGKFSFFLIKEDETLKAALALQSAGSPEASKTKMLEWETTMADDLQSLLLGEYMDEFADTETFSFQDSSKFPNGRYVSLNAAKKLSIDYSILPDRIVIATSYTALDQLLKLINAWEK